MHSFTFELDADGIGIFLLDVPGRTMNILTDAATADLESIVTQVRGDDAIKGVVLASGKANGFCAGTDLGELGANAGLRTSGDERAAALSTSARMSRALRALETCGKPVAAALEGLALGGGFELALAAHYRVATPSARVGLPEVTVGLLPGAGGTQRVPRLAGVAAALELMIGGAPIGAAKAKEIGLIDEIVERGEAILAAKRWIRTGGTAVQPWDEKNYVVPDHPYSAQANPTFVLSAAGIQRRCYGNYPAQENIARCVYEGSNLPMDAALRVESRLFLDTVQTPQARAMIRSLFVSKQALAKGAAGLADVAPSRVAKASVIGAGMMGAGIAYVQARAGIDTVLVDVDQAAVDRGRRHSESLVADAVAKGTSTIALGNELLRRIVATIEYSAIADSDLVIEAVFENRALKADVTRRAESQLANDAILASNTSTLPIDSLANAARRPANFIGIHFFSPVNRMELVEVIMGPRTSRETLAKALAYCRQIRKVPIVVNDSPGFYTSRVFNTYVTEGLEMLLEGIAPAIIDNVGRMTGMPRGPLELIDDVAIDLVDSVAKQRREDTGMPDPNGGTDKALIDMVTAGRFGRKNGKGFYDYAADGAKQLWPGLDTMFPVTVAHSSPASIYMLKRRLLHRQAIEAARCIDEGVIGAPRDADVGAILGWGFAPWTGGPISLIDSLGITQFVAECDELTSELGSRFAPPRLLRQMAAAGDNFYPQPGMKAAA